MDNLPEKVMRIDISRLHYKFLPALWNQIKRTDLLKGE